MRKYYTIAFWLMLPFLGWAQSDIATADLDYEIFRTDSVLTKITSYQSDLPALAATEEATIERIKEWLTFRISSLEKMKFKNSSVRISPYAVGLDTYIFWLADQVLDTRRQTLNGER